MGWTGAGWRFHFPQDISYIHPALLRMGHYDLAKRIVEFYRERIDDIRAITHRIYGGRGTMWAWEFPIGTGTDLLKNDSPNPYQYEIHNAAYPARMAYETSLHLNDAAWTAAVALPVIRESAEFYASHMVKEANGRYSLEVTPSMSQDEFAKPNGRNYLCALYSARYTFRVASAMGLKDYDEYLRAGLAFDRRGHRVGYGGGYYDRWLAAHPGHPTIALCYDFQLLESIETEAHDIRVDAVITETL